MLAVKKDAGAFLYCQVIELINQMVESGTLKAGDKLPSLRKLSARLGVSLPVVKQAYLALVDQGKVSARPQSGYYIRPNLCKGLLSLKPRERRFEAVSLSCRSLIEKVYQTEHMAGLMHLGMSNPTRARPATQMLNRSLRRAMSRAGDDATDYAPINGDLELRRQLALCYLDQGLNVDPDEIIITNGAQEALSLALQAVAAPGDVIAVESPTFFGILELIESLGMRAVEIETCHEDGLWLEDLRRALDRVPIRACLFSTAINNPLGSLMPEATRSDMVALLEERDIPLIEDDVYTELCYQEQRPRIARSYAKKGRVLTCSSFSKTASPGYRVGWILPGVFRENVARFKRAHSASSPYLLQLALTEFIRYGEYETHLKALRKQLIVNMERMRGLISKHFPEQTRVSSPKGGAMLWLELPEVIDSVDLFHAALEIGVGIAPGSIFSSCNKFKNFIRLSYGRPWTPELVEAIGRLGKFIAQKASGESFNCGLSEL